MPTRRSSLAAVVVAALALLVAGAPAEAKRAKPIRLHISFPVPPGDLEVCEFVPVHVDGTYDMSNVAIKNVGFRSDFVSHHFLLYSYNGTNVADFPPEGTIVPDKACLNFGPSDRSARLLVGGSQGKSNISNVPPAMAKELALKIPTVTGSDGKQIIGFILNSHWINGSTKTRKATVRVKINPAKPHTIRQFVQPIFDVGANIFIHVPPHSVAVTPTSGTLGPISWTGWAPGQPAAFAQLLGASQSPTGPACVVMVTAHMHKRGKLFSVDYVPAGGAPQNVFQADDYTDPGQKLFDPPLLVSPGARLQYQCTHDNGMTTPVKLGCEEKPGQTPGQLIWAKRCSHLGPDPEECTHQEGDGNRTFTGNCVEANLVFGFTSDDEMCILPGTYYPADPVHGCDLSSLPLLN